MGKITTHILDTARGKPAGGVQVELWDIMSEPNTCLATATTNADGRLDAPILSGADLKAATYELRFFVGNYFAAQADISAKPAFLDIIPLRFGINDPDSDYHIPLLVSPFGYSTYRGS